MKTNKIIKIFLILLSVSLTISMNLKADKKIVNNLNKKYKLKQIKIK